MSATPSGKLAIPHHLRERQVIASDPHRSVWVSANAGSGKTHVLTQRVIRLLLTGVAPSRILSLTFTKAAAAQMAQRVFDTLSGWSLMDDGALRAAIVETGASAPTAADLRLARRLFTRAIETPGGLKIQTIHAFCERLLHLFPFEANVPARFAVAEDARASDLMARATREAVAQAQRSAGRRADQLRLLADLVGSTGLDSILKDAVSRRATAHRTGADLQAALAERLGADALTSVASVLRAMVEEGIAPARWAALAEALEGGTANDRKQAGRLRAAAALHADRTAPAQVLGFYRQVFFTADGDPRDTIATKRFCAAHPVLASDLAAEASRLVLLEEQLKIARALERTEALLALADDVRARYARAKVEAGLLDFDDLIERTLALLEHCDSGWVLHKLDSGIDHVLIDEAQDTSESQWQILQRLTDEFTVGDGSRPTTRSVFVVGDEKQSIFSFQGAAPTMFDTMRSAFERRFRAAEQPFERVPLTTSFRSVPGILKTVDTVFGIAAHQDGLVTAPDVWPQHESIRVTLPGLVEIWPTAKPVAVPDPADWSIPVDAVEERSPPAVVAERVAEKIRRLIASDSAERVHDGRGGSRRPIRAGDILVLVRTRGPFFEAVIRALKNRRVPVAGADRLDVAHHIAVLDLVAAGRASLLPEDDLSLACLLKSPLLGFGDDDLIALAPERTGSLYAALAASSDPRHESAFEALERWRTRASEATPFAFFIEILGRDGGRRSMEARLGAEAHDAIDEFLRLALAHERDGAPSLGAFLDEVEALDTTIKRDMEAPGDAVRVMTVHAAKGLEAKIVFLPDTCSVPASVHDPVIFDLNKSSGLPPLLVWSPRKDDDAEAIASARAAARRETMREYRRLLYVALTRAEERLYIAGYEGARDPQPDCWNGMIAAAFPDAEQVPAFWDESESVRRIVSVGDAGLASQKPNRGLREDGQGSFALAPSWLRQPVQASAVGLASVAPSALPSREPIREAGSANQHASASIAQRRLEAMERGTALHLLLQHLPGVEEHRRREVGATLLAARASGVEASDADALLVEALRIIGDPRLSALFGPEARAEVSVRGRLPLCDGGMQEVSGTVDRLAITEDSVLVADFKSGPPDQPPPQSYVNQLAIYSRVLASLWPNRAVQTILVWTRGPTIVSLDERMLASALRSLGFKLPETSP